jgi:DNA-binding response OmpR family regulator
MLRLLLLETQSAFAERLAAALSSDYGAHCERMDLQTFEQTLSTDKPPRYDALLLDLRQVHSELRDICRRASSRFKNHPIVAVTSLEDVDAAIRLVEAGADDVCLRNECEPDFMLKRIRMAVARHDTHVLLHKTAGSFGYTPASVPALDALMTSERPTGADESLASDGPRIHVLCIDPLEEVPPHTTLIRTGGFDLPVDIQSVAAMREAVQRLNETTIEIVVIRLDDYSPESLDLITALRAFAPDAHVFFSASGADADFLVEAVRHGADDCLDDTRGISPALIRSMRVAFARKWHALRGSSVPEDEGSAAPRSQTISTLRVFQQRQPRYYVTKSAVAIPINPDLTPNQTVCAEGFTVDISQAGIGFEIGQLADLPSELLLAGVEGDDGVLYFATVQVQHWAPTAGRLHVGAQFVPPERELLRDENLIPSLQGHLHRFATGLPTETLIRWAEMGILRPILVDRVYVCPKCGSMPTFRKGCRSCGSIHVASQPLILHADCAYLGTVTEFNRDGRVVCPKCGMLEVPERGGFARHNGPCRCLDCHWSDSEAEVVGQCLNCRWHFPLTNANEQDLIGYQANRLDPRLFFGR